MITLFSARSLFGILCGLCSQSPLICRVILLALGPGSLHLLIQLFHGELSLIAGANNLFGLYKEQ